MITDFRLQVFLKVSETLSFTKSSVYLNITQPAITKHIKELERACGGALFIRQGNKISLTPLANTLLPIVKEILNKYQDLNDAIQIDNNIFSGTLALGASSTIAQYILPPILAKFNKRYPNIAITLYNGNSEEISQQLIDKVLDFAVVEDDHKNPSLHYTPFTTDNVILVTNSKNRDIKESIEITELCNYPLILRENGSGTLSVIKHALKAHNIPLQSLKITMQLGSSESIIRYLLNSHASAFISQYAVSNYLENRTLKVIQIKGVDISRTLRFVSLHGESNRIVELFKEFCTDTHNQKL